MRDSMAPQLVRQLLTGLFMLTILGGVGYAGEILPSKSQITAVTVMSSYAEITRTVTATCPVGEHQVEVLNLPAALDSRSLHLAPHPGLTLHGVSLDTVTRTLPPVAMPDSVREQFAKLNTDLTALESRVLGLRKQVELLHEYRANMVQAAIQDSAADSSANDWTVTMDTLATQESDLLVQIRTHERARQTIIEKKQAILKTYPEASRPTSASIRRALIGLSNPKAGVITFTLKYRVDGPQWRVRQALRYDPEAHQLTLQSEAVVQQETGEDWTNVSLALSTRMPPAGLQAPRVPPLVLQGQRSMSNLRLAAAASSQDSGAVSFESKTEVDPQQDANASTQARPATLPHLQPTRPVQVKPTESLNEYAPIVLHPIGEVYQVQEQVNLPSSASLQFFPLRSVSLPAQSYLEAIPRSSTAVYRRVTLVNTTAATIQPSRADLFWDANLVGTTQTQAVAPGDSWTLSFGTVPDLDVIPGASASAQIGNVSLATNTPDNQSRIYHFDYSWTLLNRTASPQTVRVLETIPVSEISTVVITVDTEKSSPHQQSKDGILSFPVTVPSKGSAPVHLLYRVRLPMKLEMP